MAWLTLMAWVTQHAGMIQSSSKHCQTATPSSMGPEMDLKCMTMKTAQVEIVQTPTVKLPNPNPSLKIACTRCPCHPRPHVATALLAVWSSELVAALRQVLVTREDASHKAMRLCRGQLDP